MRNLLDAKPESYFKSAGFSRLVMEYVQKADIEGKRILDVGCGYGSFVLSTLSWNPSEVVGVDITTADIETAKRHIRDPRANFLVSSALRLPFPNEHFETITSWEVLEHIPKGTESQYFAEIYRVLKPRGTFYLSTPFRSFLSCVGDPAWWLIGHRHYSEKEVRAFSLAAGFKVRDLSFHGDIFAILFALNLYIAKWIFRRKPFFGDFFDRKLNEGHHLNKPGFVGMRAIFVK